MPTSGLTTILRGLNRAVFVGIALLASPVRAQQISVSDGDTLVVNGERIRLSGIDAPENGQTCLDRAGIEYDCSMLATMALEELVIGKSIECRSEARDRYGRTLAACYVEGRDVGAQMVRQGWALAFRRYSIRYVPEEDEARLTRRGMWAGSFVPPWEWRAGRR